MGKQAAGTGKAGLDLVTDEQYPLLVAQGAQRLEEADRCRVEATLALDAFDDDGRDARRIDIALEELVQRLQALGLGDPQQGIRVGNAIELGREGTEAAL